jgi:NAD(P)-dependent dehydrogenase (short-subunit alcohol dehydrogenase family)
MVAAPSQGLGQWQRPAADRLLGLEPERGDEHDLHADDYTPRLAGRAILPAGLKTESLVGARTGIGRGAAVELARQGADVVLNYHSNAKGALEALAEIEAMGRRAVAIRADLSRVDECRRLIEEGARFLGGLDALVNNSGHVLDHPFLETTEEQSTTLMASTSAASTFAPNRLFRTSSLVARRCPRAVYPGRAAAS